MEKIMENDDGLESLSNIEVMDTYVRYMLADAMMKFYGKRPDGFSNDRFQEAMDVLKNQTREGVRCWSIKPSRRGILKGFIGRTAAENRSEDYIVEVFDELTDFDNTAVAGKDGYTRDECVEMARDKLKKVLRGSMGMPNDRVVRERLDRLTETE